MKKIWVVYEDNHGDVSYWSTKRKAYKEARDMIMSDPISFQYVFENMAFPYHPDDGRKITKEEIKDEEIEDGSFGVYVRNELFEKSWR